MTEQRDHLLTGAYALDALPGDERASFEAHLAECDSCTTETAELTATASRLALLTERPAPAHLRAAVLREVERTPQRSPVVADLAAHRSSRSRVRATLAVGLAAAVAAVIGTVVVLDQDPAADIRAAADAQTFDAAILDGGAATLIVSASQDAGLVTFAGLDEPAEGEAYQLWLVDADGPRPVGEQFQPEDDGTASAVIDDVSDADAVAMTLEAGDDPTVPTEPLLTTIPTSDQA